MTDFSDLMERVEKYNTLKSEGKLSREREGALDTFNEVMDLLESGELRTAEPTDDGWQVNTWVKQGLMLGFPLGNVVVYNGCTDIHFADKDTFPLRKIDENAGFRVVPPAAGIRRGSHVGQGVILMQHGYANVGANIGDRTMVEGLAGSCCQIGEDSHLSDNTTIGGVLDPIGAYPVILGKNVFLGENSGVTEGTRLNDLVTLASGVHITRSTPVIDPILNLAYTARGTQELHRIIVKLEDALFIYRVHDRVLVEKDPSYGPEIPMGAVVIPGTAISSTGTLKLTPMVTKYINSLDERSYALEEALRS